MAKLDTWAWRSRFSETFGHKPNKWERERFLRDVQIEGNCWVWRGPTKRHVIDGKPYDPMVLGYVFLNGALGAKDRVISTCGRCCVVHLARVKPQHRESAGT